MDLGKIGAVGKPCAISAMAITTVSTCHPEAYTKGLEFLISYTLSKELDDAGSNLMGFPAPAAATPYNKGWNMRSATRIFLISS